MLQINNLSLTFYHYLESILYYIVICYRHYTVPLIPEIEGSATFTGKTIHTHYYRSPDEYKDKTVLILGAGPSGTDIGIDISTHAKKVKLELERVR